MTTGTPDEIETNQHEYVMNFSGNLINLFDNETVVDVILLTKQMEMKYLLKRWRRNNFNPRFIFWNYN